MLPDSRVLSAQVHDTFTFFNTVANCYNVHISFTKRCTSELIQHKQGSSQEGTTKAKMMPTGSAWRHGADFSLFSPSVVHERV